jgi:predicted MFS family arabinose efflux permease
MTKLAARSPQQAASPPVEAAQGAPPPALAIACLSLAAFGSGASLRINDALLPRLAADFSISVGAAAQVISVFAIAYGAAQLVFGPLGDRFGKVKVIGYGCAACAASALLCALAPGFAWLRLARALAGISAAAIIPLSMAWIGDVVPYEGRQPVLARFLIGQILGLAGGVWLGGFAADHLGWRTPYALLAALFAAVCAAVLLIERRLPPRARATRRESGSAARRMVADFAHVLAARWARVILGCVFLEGVLLYGPFAFFATHLHRSFGVSLSTAGSLVMLFGFGGFAFALASQRLVSLLGETGLARGGGALLCASLLAIGYAPTWGWAIPGCLGAGLGFYMLHNTLQVNATQMTPARRGPAVSAFAASFFLGQSAGVAIGGFAVGRIGTANVIGLGALGLVLVALAFARLRSRR